MNSTGNKLRALRKKHNMTAQELADKLGVTAPAISLWEHNKREIDNSTLLRIATIFNVTTDYLLGAPAFKPTLSMTNTEIFAKNLKHYMWLNNISQRDLANSLKVSDASVSHWLNAARMPRMDKLQSIATILGITLQELIEDSTHNKQEKPFKPTLSKRDELDIQKRLERLMNDLDSETGLAFYNGDEEIDDETRELLRASLESSLRITKLKAKEKFTPKKYRR